MSAQLTVNKSDLVSELSLAVGSVEKKTTIPILANVKLEATAGGSLGICATDLEQAMISTCEAKVKEPGAFTVPAKRLLDYVRLLPEGEITLKVGENNWVSVTAGKSRSRLAGMSVDSFPEFPPCPQGTFDVPAAMLSRMIKQTAFAISQEESRFTLQGALVEIEDGALRMVATDGHRLALAEGQVDAPSQKFLIPRKGLVNVAKLADAAPEGSVILMAVEDSHLFFVIDNRLLVVRRLTGNLPDYQRVMPRHELSVTVNRAEMHAALSRLVGFADERSRCVRMTIGEGEIKLRAIQADIGESEESVACESADSLEETGMNATYLIDALGAIADDSVKISFNDPAHAIQLEPAGNASSKCVVMPMRVWG